MKQGIFPHMPMDEYLSIPALSSGVAHTLLTVCPLHAWYRSALNPDRERENSREMDLGTYAHACLLEGGTDRLVSVDATDWRTKAAREERDAARREGRLPILAHKVAKVDRMVKVAKEYIAGSEIASVFDIGGPEQTLIWQQESGVFCKARPDWMSQHIILHYKTTSISAEPAAWQRSQLVTLGYDMAIPFYANGYRAEIGQEVPKSVFLVQETTAPYSCSLHALDHAMMELASAKVARAIAMWAECVKSGDWPAYQSSICYASPAPWQIADSEARGWIDDAVTWQEAEQGTSAYFDQFSILQDRAK